jgi:hypothetical protein
MVVHMHSDFSFEEGDGSMVLMKSSTSMANREDLCALVVQWIVHACQLFLPTLSDWDLESGILEFRFLVEFRLERSLSHVFELLS